jgi:GxxExxY protein
MSFKGGRMLEEALTHSVIGAFYDVHQGLGFGFREYIYARALELELTSKGHGVQRELGVPVYWRGEPIAWQALDMVVDGKLVIETKATERLHPVAVQQLFSYLCSTTMEVGLLLHFGREARFQRVICENRLSAITALSSGAGTPGTASSRSRPRRRPGGSG